LAAVLSGLAEEAPNDGPERDGSASTVFTAALALPTQSMAIV